MASCNPTQRGITRWDKWRRENDRKHKWDRWITKIATSENRNSERTPCNCANLPFW